MKVAELAYWLTDFAADIRSVDGRLFIDRHGLGVEALRQEASAYGSLEEAQVWMNICPIDGFIEAAVGDDWDLEHRGVETILEVYRTVFEERLRCAYPDARAEVESWIDDHNGELGVILVQDPEANHSAVAAARAARWGATVRWSDAVVLEDGETYPGKAKIRAARSDELPKRKPAPDA